MKVGEWIRIDRKIGKIKHIIPDETAFYTKYNLGNGYLMEVDFLDGHGVIRFTAIGDSLPNLEDLIEVDDIGHFINNETKSNRQIVLEDESMLEEFKGLIKTKEITLTGYELHENRVKQVIE